MNDVAPILAVTTQTHVMASEVSNRRAKTRHNFQLPGTVPPERSISSYYLAELPGTGAVSQPNSAGASRGELPADFRGTSVLASLTDLVAPAL